MTRDSPPCDSLAIVMTGIEGVESRSNKLQQAKSSTHILLDRWGLRTREDKEWNLHSFDHLVMERMKVERKEIRSHDPNPLVGHHNHATKWHKAILMVRSDAVVMD
jgi:hypothetical protein